MNGYVVADSNVYISAIVHGGIPEDALAYAAREFSLAGSLYIFNEVRRILLSKKFRWQSKTIEDALSIYLANIILAEPNKIEMDIRDIDDIPILACVLAADADYLITGDKDLLALKRVGRCRIVTPRRFLESVF